MSQIRFHIADAPSTEWIEELVLSGQSELPTAVAVMSQLRPRFPTAAISIERRGDIKTSKPQLFRYKILVREGTMRVTPNPENPLGLVKLANATLQSCLFQESERSKVVADIREQFPDAQLVSEAV